MALGWWWLSMGDNGERKEEEEEGRIVEEMEVEEVEYRCISRSSSLQQMNVHRV